MNRALRAATIGVLLLVPGTLAACSSGQVNQTSTQVRDKVGATVQIGQLTLREVTLAYPHTGSYAQGDEAVLQAAIVNEGGKPDTLVSIKGPDFQGVRVTGTGSQATAPLGSTATTAAPGTTAAATTAASTTAAGTTATGSASSGASSPATAATLPSEAPSSATNIQIPTDTAVFFGQNAPHVTLVGITRQITPAQAVPMTFTFRDAGSVTIDAIVANPPSELPRTSSYNFEPNTQASEPANRAGGGNIGG